MAHAHPHHQAPAHHRGYGIHIKPSHKGLLHKALGVPEGEPIPLAAIAKAKHSKSPAMRKRATFAMNAKTKFHHGRHGG